MHNETCRVQGLLGKSVSKYGYRASISQDVSNMKLKVGHPDSGQTDLSNKIDRKYDKLDSKIDRVLYTRLSLALLGLS